MPRLVVPALSITDVPTAPYTMQRLLYTTCACLVVTAASGAQQPALAPDTSWVRRSAIYEVFVRDFSPSGDLRGVLRGLDRIQGSGANVVWLMPIHPVGTLNRKPPLGSPYSVRDYRAINPAFGKPTDFRALVRGVHERGMKIIIDWVPNHTSWDNVWVKAHPEFYVRNAQGEMSVPRNERGELTDWTDVAQLDYRNPGLRREMIASMRFWLEEYSIDGFRVDVAGFVPDDFWSEALPALRGAVQRPILLLAEWGDRRMHRLGFDLTYAWDMYSSLKEVWRGAPARTFVERAVADADSMPAGGMRLRFTTNHDETAWDNPPVVTFDRTAGARAAFVAAALLPGRPLIYNGQEIESPQKLRLFYRDPIDWSQPDTAGTRAFYRRVLTLVRTESAFVTGALGDLATTAEDDVIAYRRGEAIVVVNTRPRSIGLRVTGFDLRGAHDLLSDSVQRGDSLVLAPYGAAVLAPLRRQ